MKTLRYISVQPATDYYAWQVEVMLQNFLKHGINPNQVDLVCATRGPIPEKWITLSQRYNTFRFFFYPDDRTDFTYIPSIRPRLLKRHFTEHPELSQEAIFYHDCDMIMTKPPQWDKFLDDDVWYLSDTEYYIGADYIKSKKHGVYERMCEIVDIDENIPVINQKHSGGAQYIMKNVTAEFWDKVERDSLELYNFFLKHLEEFPESPDYHPIQKWTADMWAVLWNAWYFKHEVQVVPEMHFAWATSGLDQWENYTIYHNAGVTPEYAEKDRLFYKGLYQSKTPYDVNLSDYNERFASHLYVKEILETAKTTCLVDA